MNVSCTILSKDMLKDGCSLSQILRAGQWRSVPFLRYLDEMHLEKETALAIGMDSDDDDWIQ